MTDKTIHGSCECGAVEFESDGPWRDITVCHCSQCRKTSGHLWAATSVPADSLRIRDKATLEWRDSSPEAQRGFCNACGSSLFYRRHDEGTVSIGPGALDGETGLEVARHIFQKDKGDYYESPDAKASGGVWDAPVPGSCECGSVRVTVTEAPTSTWICHCEECRKSSGYLWAGAQLRGGGYQVIADKTLKWFWSTDVVKKGFCSGCGSTVFWWLEGRDAPAVSCGILENPTGLMAQKHIFTGEMGDYEGFDDDLPRAPQFDLEGNGK